MGGRISKLVSRIQRHRRRPDADTRNNNATIIENKYALAEEHITYFIPIELLNPALLPYLENYGISTDDGYDNPSQYDRDESVFTEDDRSNRLHDQLYEDVSVDQLPMGIPLPVTFRNGQPVILTPKLSQKQSINAHASDEALETVQKAAKPISKIEKIKQRFRKKQPQHTVAIEVSVEKDEVGRKLSGPNKNSPDKHVSGERNELRNTTEGITQVEDNTKGSATSASSNTCDQEKQLQKQISSGSDGAKKASGVNTPGSVESLIKKGSSEALAQKIVSRKSSNAEGSKSCVTPDSKGKVSRKASKCEIGQATAAKERIETDSGMAQKELLSSQKSTEKVSRKKSLQEKICSDSAPVQRSDSKKSVEKIKTTGAVKSNSTVLKTTVNSTAAVNEQQSGFDASSYKVTDTFVDKLKPQENPATQKTPASTQEAVKEQVHKTESTISGEGKRERRAKKVKRHKSTMEKEAAKEVYLKSATRSEKDIGALQREGTNSNIVNAIIKSSNASHKAPTLPGRPTIEHLTARESSQQPSASAGNTNNGCSNIIKTSRSSVKLSGEVKPSSSVTVNEQKQGKSGANVDNQSERVIKKSKSSSKLASDSKTELSTGTSNDIPGRSNIKTSTDTTKLKAMSSRQSSLDKPDTDAQSGKENASAALDLDGDDPNSSTI